MTLKCGGGGIFIMSKYNFIQKEISYDCISHTKNVLLQKVSNISLLETTQFIVIKTKATFKYLKYRKLQYISGAKDVTILYIKT